MYDEELDKGARPKSWNLCDDLGQIEYIFSDKTGTLTSNIMDFKRASIDGVVYGRQIDSEHQTPEHHTKDEELMMERFKTICSTKYFDKNPGFVDSNLPQHIIDNGVQASKIREFFSLLAVCHTVLVETADETDPNKIVYRAQSPDEAALVSAAKNVGFACLKRTENRVEIDLLGESRTYTILNVIEFNSDRKRMSVIMKRPEGGIVLLCKGADSVIYERLSKENDEDLLSDTSFHLQKFANEGQLF
jgi:phospholipid-translocating ATPase